MEMETIIAKNTFTSFGKKEKGAGTIVGIGTPDNESYTILRMEPHHKL
jgi:hypothetical protein